MKADIVTTEDLQLFKTEILEEIKKLMSETPKYEAGKKWLKSHQIQRMLGISPGTLQNLRINGTIPYTKIGGVIFYSQEDINILMQKHKRNTFK